jgi:AbrB family looped-hinge helix DNA binding protein
MCHNLTNMAEQRYNEITVGPQGRFVIPAKIRKEMGIVAGETLIARLNAGQIVLEKPETVLARLKTTFSNVSSDISLVDELIADRQDEASQEAEA